MSKLIALYLEFFRTGLFAVGGGLATIPFLKELIGRHDWFTLPELINMIGISESTPGPLGVNMATYVGTTTAGIIGSIVAVLGLVTPSVIIIIIIAKCIERFKNSKLVQSLFSILRPAVIGFVLCAVIDIFILCFLNVSVYELSHEIVDLFSFVNIFIYIIMLVCYKRFDIHPILLIVLSAIIGIVFKL